MFQIGDPVKIKNDPLNRKLIVIHTTKEDGLEKVMLKNEVTHQIVASWIPVYNIERRFKSKY